MTIATILKRANAGEVVAVTNPRDCMEVITWASTVDGGRGWHLHFDVEKKIIFVSRDFEWLELIRRA